MECDSCKQALKKENVKGSLRKPYCKECFDRIWGDKISYAKWFLLEESNVL